LPIWTRIAERYRERLGEIPGIGWQHVPEGSRSSYKDFIITVDAEQFGAHRDDVVPALHAEGVPTRPYYAPPLHRQQAYAHVETGALPVTDGPADRVVALPLWADMRHGQADGVAGAAPKDAAPA